MKRPLTDLAGFNGKVPGGRSFPRHLLLVVFIIMTLLSAALLPLFEKLAVVDNGTGKVLYFEDVKPGETFSILYTHSVNKSPVEDVFEVQRDKTIMLKKTVFRAFGAGIPCEPEPGQSFHVYEDRMELVNINRKLDPFLLFVGLIANHTLKTDAGSVELKQLIEPQRTVRIEIKGLSIYSLIRGD